ncbi:MAG: hypothetical protein RI909_2243 [Bacteroidota bacterium]|jgi:predicted anti-sigma-YlaC factor YlaD
MKCQDFEKRIYLYRELTDDEKKLTDIHISGCESCQALLRRVSQQQNLIKTIATKKILAKQPQRLTEQIMNSIEQSEKRANPLRGVTAFLDSLFVRYAFAVLSFLLISFLYQEQQDANPIASVAHAEIQHGSILNTNTFLKRHVKNRTQRTTSLSISKYSYAKSERLEKTL